MTNYVVVGCDWISRYWLTESLFNDSNQENNYQIFHYGIAEEFFKTPATLAEFASDERVQYIDIEKHPEQLNWKSINFDYTDAVLFSPLTLVQTGDLIKFFEHYNFGGNIVLPSTWEVYGYRSAKQIPIKETDILLPGTEYGKFKMDQERLLMESKLNWVVLRYGHVFGPYMPSDGDVYYIIESAIKGQLIKIDQPAGRYLDPVYVSNLVSPIDKALTIEKARRQIFNLGDVNQEKTDKQGRHLDGDNSEKTIGNIARAIRHLIASDCPIEVSTENIPQSKGYHCKLDITKAAEILDYKPLIYPLQAFLQTALWMESTIDDSKIPAIVDTYPTLKKGIKVGETLTEDEE
jgi:hypothetical protein